MCNADVRSIKGLALLISVCSLLASCELGIDQSTLVKPNYELLAPCARPDRAEATSIVLESLCGTLSVYEDRASNSGRKIDLNIMLIPATSSVVKPDPIFFLAGGPGQAAVEMGPLLFSRLSKLRRERDVVLVDQRGTGLSNSLACEPEENTPMLDDLSYEEILSVQQLMIRKCLGQYDANPALYTTPIAMDDLNEVRTSLGYRDINLYGISYGTRAALVYLRRHESSVRSVILDSVVPMSMKVGEMVAVDAQASFEMLLADCQAQVHCAEAFPQFEQHFNTLMDRLKDSPEDVTIVHPRTGELIEGKLSDKNIAQMLRGILYDRDLSTLIPLAIEEAYKGNYQPLVTSNFVFSGGDGNESSGMSIGMMASVLCSEDLSLVSTPTEAKNFDNPIYQSLKPVCEFWPKGTLPDGYFEPVSSDKPALLLSGEFDPITPPKYGWEASATLSNSEHVVVPGVGHAASLRGCVPEIMRDFVETIEPKQLSTSCVMNLDRPPFFTSFAGAVTSVNPGEQVANKNSSNSAAEEMTEDTL
jgi:pimeloyl-ACP methyl ester carboxylesterase